MISQKDTKELVAALNAAREMSKRARGDKNARCGVNNLNSDTANYLDSWVIHPLETFLEKRGFKARPRT